VLFAAVKIELKERKRGKEERQKTDRTIGCQDVRISRERSPIVKRRKGRKKPRITITAAVVKKRRCDTGFKTVKHHLLAVVR